jgi:hypothetical protein
MVQPDPPGADLFDKTEMLRRLAHGAEWFLIEPNFYTHLRGMPSSSFEESRLSVPCGDIQRSLASSRVRDRAPIRKRGALWPKTQEFLPIHPSKGRFAAVAGRNSCVFSLNERGRHRVPPEVPCQRSRQEWLGSKPSSLRAFSIDSRVSRPTSSCLSSTFGNSAAASSALGRDITVSAFAIT